MLNDNFPTFHLVVEYDLALPSGNSNMIQEGVQDKFSSYMNKKEKENEIASYFKLNTNKNNYVWVNKNKLLSLYKYTTGGKTGFTERAKRTLVSTASKDGIDLVVVTLNDGNDWEDHQNLFEYGFNNYKNLTL